MASTASTELPVGTRAPAFTLPDTRNNQPVGPHDYTGQPMLITFICNHCPYVVHILDALVALAARSETRGVATIAISSNDIASYPQDGPLKMAELARQRSFGFPYCFDETQVVARAYEAVCTPDIYLFDADHRLYYRGQFDDTRPSGRGNAGEAHGGDLWAATMGLLDGRDAPTDVKAGVGCSIKWR